MRTLMFVMALGAATGAMAYGVAQLPPDVGVAPEMFDWRPGLLGWLAAILLGVGTLALGMRFAIQFVRWLVEARNRAWPS